MNRLLLKHLTFLGSGKPPATIEFGPTATVVRGPSDTGKSFIVDAINFMLGARSLKEIPEREGYSDVLLGIILPSGETMTLARGVNGGGFSMLHGDFRDFPLPVSDGSLSAVHNADNLENLSNFLLNELELTGKRLRKNARNSTVSLSFRDLSHLIIIDETTMQSEHSPALTGDNVHRTKEISLLKLLLQSEDDSSLVETPAPAIVRQLTDAKSGVIDQLIADLEDRLAQTPDETELREQLIRLNASVRAQSESVQELTDARDRIAGARSRTQVRLRVNALRTAEMRALERRFGLLRSQYESDLSRLEMIQEAGNLLGFLAPGTCVYCGASPEHQHSNHEEEASAETFSESIAAETAKTMQLRTDLLRTLEDLNAQNDDLRQEESRLGLVLAEQSAALAQAERALRPTDGGLAAKLETRSRVERALGLFEQIQDLRRARALILDSVAGETAAASEGMSLGALADFSEEIANRLRAWGFPDYASVRYDRGEQDLIAGDQLRRAHGKGVRSILHAAFTIALAQYCFDRDLPHPGFVVLDSPLITYRAPDADEEAGPDLSVARAFYADIATHFDGQIIVMENVDPPDGLVEDAIDIAFSGRIDFGRLGFFPTS